MEGLTLEEMIVGIFNVNQSLILNKDEKAEVEHHRNNNTHKLIVLKFSAGGDINPLCGLDLSH